MPYVLQSRDPAASQFIPSVWMRGGVVYDNYTESEFRRLSSPERTYSWRTGRGLAEHELASGVFAEKTGEEMRDELRRTGDIYHPAITSSSAESHSEYDSGHEFWTEKGVDRSLYPSRNVYSDDGWAYSGPIGVVPYIDQTLFPALRTPSEAQMRSSGNHLYHAAMPTRPDANLAVLVGETVQRLPSLPGVVLMRDRNMQAVGGEYLNVTFGIKPMIADVLKCARAVLEFNSNLERFKEHAGKNLHRRRQLPQIRETELIRTSDTFFGRPYLARFRGQDWNYKFFPSGTGISVVDEHVIDMRFSGSFTYYLHEDSSFLGRMARYGQLAEKLLGAGLTPSTFWELTPWSWLIDWAIDVGTFIKVANRNASDGLVLRYGYLMIHTSVTRHIVSTRTTDGLGRTVDPIPHELFRERKERKRANPYGFGLGWELEMTPSRWAILAALGLTKAPKTLRTAE